MSRDSSLTDKQARFCKEYVVHFNATRAAKASGYSLKTAEKIGSENLKKPEVDKEIKRLLKATNDGLFFSAKDIRIELSKIAFATEFTLEGFEKLTIAEKVKALVELAKMAGAYNQDESSKTIINVNLGDKKD